MLQWGMFSAFRIVRQLPAVARRRTMTAAKARGMPVQRKRLFSYHHCRRLRTMGSARRPPAIAPAPGSAA
jgi:hypothetical protein